MTPEKERRSIIIWCDICKNKPATEIKGGKTIIEGREERDIFICCKECKKKIEDTRLNE